MKKQIWTTPNILTIARIFMVPVAVIFTYENRPPYSTLTIIILIMAIATDVMDGRIARSTNQVTNIGKLLDPIADKLVVISVMIAMVDTKLIAGWIVIIIVARELSTTGLRAIAAAGGVVIAANQWGKFKTGFQFAALILLLAGYEMFGTIILYISVVLTVVSGAIYFYNYFKDLK